MEHLCDIFLNLGLITAAIVAYLILFRRSTPIKLKGNYKQPAWNYHFRVLIARFAVKRWKKSLPPYKLEDTPRTDLNEGWDCISLRASSPDGVTVLFSIRKVCGIQPIAEVTVYIRLADGTSYRLPQHPKTAVSPWESIAGGWSAGGLKIQVLEPLERLRIIFSGLLIRNDGTKQHVRFNFIWASVSRSVHYPEDWDNSLAARALALEPWRDQQWPLLLGTYGDGSWMKWGSIQGRFTAFTPQGTVDRTEYVETRGVKERSWSPRAYRGLRRSFAVTAVARDGTAVMIRGFSYKEILTVGLTGNVRLPDYTVHSITGATLEMSEFCEHPDGIPKTYTFHVSTPKKDLAIVLNISTEGGELFSGIPHRYRTLYRNLSVSINGEIGTGILELGYMVKAEVTPLCLTPAPVLKWVSEQDVDTVTYCAPFEARAAACPGFVGGKGASLALLASVQKQNGYRVPPGFCITTKALEKHLGVNPDIIKAIQAIEAANEYYEEKNFREKCERTVELFASSDIDSEVKDEIILHMNNLRKKALEQGFEPELRFAVRSSGVGEDSEALSAAGQNDTVLGCDSDRDVIEAVKKCWASMFAFTSAYYRRQNGQPCFCGGGVVVQVLVRPKAAGVMFTRHPDNGDPTRVLVTANYGLGESVVSGTVEPDTIIVTRGNSDELVISEIKLGSKSQRVTASESGVTSETVPESERTKPCLSVTEALSLVRIGIAQDQMWAAPRDIEWAVTENDIFLLQARPITSLKRWTEEELLHELDFPIMSDDELTTFANTGEVIPKPITALTHDLILTPMEAGTCRPMIYRSPCGYDKSLLITHNRVALALYNNIYRHVSNKIDTSLRMLEFSIHGHKVADKYIHQVAMHRREPSKLSTVFLTLNTFKLILTSKSSMIDGIKVVKSMKFNMETENPQAIVDEIEGSFDKFARCMEDHCRTTSGSACSQLIAMLVLVEGAEDFTPEQCSEMNSLLSSGDVLSAEVPQALDSIAREIQESGKAEEFRKVNPKEAQKWLRINLPKVYQEVEMFLEKHGHRAIMEFDLITKPWVMVPEEMMEVLQNMKPAPATSKHRKTDDDVLSSLQTPQKPNTRKILRWLLPLCRRTVQHREITKAHVILGVHKLRLLVRRLGRILQKKWYLPDEDLVFHFRMNELKEYLRTRDPALLKKAQQRRQYLPTWNKLKFSELSAGWVRPLQMALPTRAVGDVTLAATAVCGGEVVARACVVHDLSQIQQLERGDVLITHATDIGWSPYFPLLSGIVTELGGLVSHGAVIAREYGLPCIIGAVGATEVFKTGDMVRLSGIHGIIERVQITESASDDGDVKK